MELVVAVDRNWAIGNKGELLVSIPNDHKMFRELTTDGVVILGRKTLATFPGGKPLKNRVNIVMSRNIGYEVEGATVAHSVEELLEEVKKYEGKHIFVIGGDSIYAQLLPYCDTAHVTKIDYEYAADAFFANLDADGDWEITGESDEMTYFDIPYEFVRYERKKQS